MITLSIAMVGSVGLAAAEPWKDESGHGRWEDRSEAYDDFEPRRYDREDRRELRAHKEEYRVGRCKIERKWDDSEFKEEIKCKRNRGQPAYIELY